VSRPLAYERKPPPPPPQVQGGVPSVAPLCVFFFFLILKIPVKLKSTPARAPARQHYCVAPPGRDFRRASARPLLGRLLEPALFFPMGGDPTPPFPGPGIPRRPWDLLIGFSPKPMLKQAGCCRFGSNNEFFPSSGCFLCGVQSPYGARWSESFYRTRSLRQFCD